MNDNLDGEDLRWVIVEDGFTAALANLYETLFTTGNGYLGTRGSLVGGHEGALPGTFLRGVFDHHDCAVPACDVTIDGDSDATRAVRFSLYQLLIAANESDPRVSIGANGLSGERYRGHVFWDTEVFMLPFFIYTQPETALRPLQ